MYKIMSPKMCPAEHCVITVMNSPLQTKYHEKEGKESDYRGELKKNKVWGKSFKSVVKGIDGKCSEVQRRERVKGCAMGRVYMGGKLVRSEGLL
jgi:hypothetical protein